MSAGAAAAAAAVDEWSASPGEVDGEVLEVLRTARSSGWRVGLLTNATTRLHDDLRRLRLDDAFDVVVNSADLGIAKPDPRVFEAACLSLGSPLAGCSFVDDTRVNVEAAAERGLRVHLYGGVRSLADFLGVGTSATSE